MRHFENTLSAAAYNKLRNAVGWGELPVLQAQCGLDNSWRVLSCQVEGDTVACARILWDGGYIAYLADVMVLPDYQGQGIGSSLVRELLLHLQQAIPQDWRVKVVLLAAPQKEGFYQKLGFNVRPNESEGAGMNLWLTGKKQEVL